MQLIKEQVEFIEKSIDARESQIKGYSNIFREKLTEGDGIENETQTVNFDLGLQSEYLRNRDELGRLLKILESPDTEIISEGSLTSIEVGTTFSVLFSDEDEEESFTLVETLAGLEGKHEFISTESPLGKSVQHKMVGEDFTYTITTNSSRKITMSGKVISIGKDVKDSKEYTKE